MTNTQDQYDMPHRVTYVKDEGDSSPAENYDGDDLCLVLEKVLKMATGLFLTSCG